MEYIPYIGWGFFSVVILSLLGSHFKENFIEARPKGWGIENPNE
ncbi:MAG: hypothetical protein ACI86H_001096 [bacterium]|jgi:hypothetical protein